MTYFRRMLRLGLLGNSQGGAGYVFTNAEAETYVAAMSVEPDNTRKALIDALVTALKAIGWSKFSIFYLLAAHDSQAGRLNLISPGTFTLSAVNSPSFVTDRGYTGNGTSSYLDTGWDPSNNGGTTYQQNSAHLGIFCTSGGDGDSDIGRASAGVPNLIQAGASVLGRVNNGSGGVSATVLTARGHTIINRSAAGALEAYRDGDIIGTGTTASATRDTEDLFIGRAVAGYSTDQFGAMHAGASLTDAEADALFVALNAYMLGVGADTDYMAGAWTWFTTRRAGTDTNGPFFAVTTPRGDVSVLRDGKAPVVLKRSSTIDDHADPAMLKRASDSRWIAHYLRHVDATVYQRISTNVNDVSSWGTEASLDASFGSNNYSYSNLVEVTDGIFNFLRANPAGTRSLYYSKSTDNGGTWAAVTQLLDESNPYWRIFKGGANRIDIACNNRAPQDGANILYHFYYDGGTWKNSAGSSIGSPPFVCATSLTEVYSANSSWIWDVSFGGGVPVMVFARFPTVASDHRYMYAKWNGSSWSVNEICTAGGTVYAADGVQDQYSAGICIDPDDVNTVYCSREVGSTGVFEIWKGVTADGGANWTMTQLTNNGVKSIRPNKEAGESIVSYMKGTYTTYEDFQTVIDTVAV